ncbi:MAG: sigma-70 family RNA polymerase sigma factor [Pirellulaceae bacterium]
MSFTHDRQRARFATTRWSRILSCRESTEETTRDGLQTLVSDYWYPSYAWLRRRGLNAEDAADVTQDFFVKVLTGNFLKVADPDRGRFRSYLLASLRNHLANHVRSENAQIRGGNTQILSIDFANAEERYSAEPIDVETPQQLYDRRWALTMMELALSRVRELYVRKNKSAMFDQLKHFLSAGADLSLKDVAAELRINETAARVALHRLRKRCRDSLRAEVARTLESNADLDSEVNILLGWLS